MRKLLIVLALAALLAAAVALVGVLRPDPAGAASGTSRDLVTTLGSGKVTTTPDVASVDAGVRVDAESAADAIARTAARADAIVAALRKAGGERIQTRDVSVYPRTNSDGAVTGYTAQNTVSARVAIADAGALIDAAAGAGANTIDGPMLSRSDTDALYRAALAKALADARAKAEALARAGGFDVGRVVGVEEDGATPTPAFDAVRSVSAQATRVEPGVQEIEARVSVSFEIR